MMTIMMMQRIIESVHKKQDMLPPSSQSTPDKLKLDYENRSAGLEGETQIFIAQKRISDDSRDVEMCNKSETEEDEEELNVEVDVENDETLCPVDLTRRQEKYTTTFENLLQQSKGEGFGGKATTEDEVKSLSCKRSESVCSDVSRSESPRERSPSVGTHQNRRLAFSVENILDPNKFTGRQVFSDSICCWKPNQESIGSPDFDGSETGQF